MDLGSEAGDLARLLWSWRVVFNAVPTEEERENLLSLWKDLGKQDYLKTASVSERQTAERSLVSRILMVRDTFSDVYAANHGNEEPPQELLEAITGIAAQPILRMLDRMAERRDGVIAFRAEQDKEKAALEPHRVSSRDWYSQKQETVDVKTLLTNLTSIARVYSTSLSEADRTLLMKRVDKDTAQMLSEKMQLRGYDAHDAFVFYVWLPFRVEKVYREVSRIGGESFLTSDQRGEVAAYASMIFRDWGFLLNEGHEKERLEAEEALSKTIEQGITGRIEQLRIQIERSRIYKEKFDTAFPQLGTQLTSQDAFLWAEKARSSALSDDEFQQWIDLAKELKVVDDSLTIKQALALADQWLRIGLAEELPEHYWNQAEAETIFKATFTNEQFKQAQKSGPEDSEVLRGWLQRRDRGFRSLDDPELIAALAQGSVSRNISPLLFARRAQQAIYARDMIDRAAQFNNALSKNDKRYDPAGIERFSVSDLLVYYDAIAPNSKGFDLVSTLEQTGRGEKVFGEQANRLWEDRVEASINAAFRVEHEKILRPLLPPATEPAVRQKEKKEAPSLDQRIRKLIWEKIQEPALKALPGTNDLTTSEAPSRSEMRVSMELGFSSFVQFLWHSGALTNALWITLIVGVIVFLYDFVHKSAFSRAIGDEASRPGFWKWRAFWSVTFFTTVLTQMVYISVINPGAYYLTALTASVLISVYLIWAISYKFWGWIITSLYPLYSLIVDGLWKRGILRDKSSRVTAEPIMRPIFNADDSDFQLVSENGRRIYYLTEAFFEREYPEESVRGDMKAKLGWVGRDGGVHPGTQINAVQMLLRPDRDDKYPEEQESIAFWLHRATRMMGRLPDNYMIHLFARDVDYDEFLNLDIERGLLIATLSGASRRASDEVFWEVLQSQLGPISDLNDVADSQFIESINRILLMPGFYDRVRSQVNVSTLDPEVQGLVRAGSGMKLSSKERRTLNKALLLHIYSTEIQPTNRNGWLKEGLSDAKQDDDKTTYLLRNLKNIRMNDSIRGEYYLDLLKEYGERVLVFVRHGPLEKPFDYQAEFRWLVTGTANLFGRINADDPAIADMNIDQDEFWPLWEGFNGKMITVVDSKAGEHKIRIPIPVIDGSLTPDGRLLFLDARHKEECYRMQLYIERAKWLINEAIEENKEPPQFEGYGDTHNALMTWVLEQPINSARMDAWDSRGYDERLSGPQSRFRNKVPGKSEVYSVTPFDAEIGMSAKDFVKGIAKANHPANSRWAMLQPSQITRNFLATLQTFSEATAQGSLWHLHTNLMIIFKAIRGFGKFFIVVDRYYKNSMRPTLAERPAQAGNKLLGWANTFLKGKQKDALYGRYMTPAKEASEPIRNPRLFLVFIWTCALIPLGVFVFVGLTAGLAAGIIPALLTAVGASVAMIYGVKFWPKDHSGGNPRAVQSHDEFESLQNFIGLMLDVHMYDDAKPSFLGWVARLFRWLGWFDAMTIYTRFSGAQKYPVSNRVFNNGCVRGLLATPLWGVLLLIGLVSVKVPGIQEITVPGIAEWLFVSIMFMLLMDKWVAPTYNYFKRLGWWSVPAVGLFVAYFAIPILIWGPVAALGTVIVFMTSAAIMYYAQYVSGMKSKAGTWLSVGIGVLATVGLFFVGWNLVAAALVGTVIFAVLHSSVYLVRKILRSDTGYHARYGENYNLDNIFLRVGEEVTSKEILEDAEVGMLPEDYRDYKNAVQPEAWKKILFMPLILGSYWNHAFGEFISSTLTLLQYLWWTPIYLLKAIQNVVGRLLIKKEVTSLNQPKFDSKNVFDFVRAGRGVVTIGVLLMFFSMGLGWMGAAGLGFLEWAGWRVILTVGISGIFLMRYPRILAKYKKALEEIKKLDKTIEDLEKSRISDKSMSIEHKIAAAVEARNNQMLAVKVAKKDLYLYGWLSIAILIVGAVFAPSLAGFVDRHWIVRALPIHLAFLFGSVVAFMMSVENFFYKRKLESKNVSVAEVDQVSLREVRPAETEVKAIIEKSSVKVVYGLLGYATFIGTVLYFTYLEPIPEFHLLIRNFMEKMGAFFVAAMPADGFNLVTPGNMMEGIGRILHTNPFFVALQISVMIGGGFWMHAAVIVGLIHWFRNPKASELRKLLTGKGESWKNFKEILKLSRELKERDLLRQQKGSKRSEVRTAASTDAEQEALIQSVRAMTDSELDATATRILADRFRELMQKGVMAALSPDSKLLFYSAGPATGKGTVLKTTFLAEDGDVQAPYQDLVKKFVIGHTRKFRPHDKEKDGRHYHFRTAEHWEALHKRLGADYLELRYINKQLQVLPIKTFVNPGVVVPDVQNATLLEPKDVVLSYDIPEGQLFRTELKVARPGVGEITLNDIIIPADKPGTFLPRDEVVSVSGDTVIVNRVIVGLRDLLNGNHFTIFEGGYDWFRWVRDPANHSGALTLFLSPFEEADFPKRASNMNWILTAKDANGEALFPLPKDVYLAFEAIDALVEGKGDQQPLGEFDIADRADLQERVKVMVRESQEQVTPLLEANEAIILDDKDFIRELNGVMTGFGASALNTKDYMLARALANELQHRLFGRDGAKSFRDESGNRTDSYNRILEGVFQIMTRANYGSANVLPNARIYDVHERKVALAKLGDKFARRLFEHAIDGIRRSELRDSEIEEFSTPVRSEVRENLDRLVRGELTPFEIEQLPLDVKTEILRGLVSGVAGQTLADHRLQEKMLVLGGPPGSGKDLGAKSFIGEGIPLEGDGMLSFKDLFGGIILYHSRAPRFVKGKWEINDIKYGFADRHVGDPRNRILRLSQLRYDDGTPYAIKAFVNKQLQGVATRRFEEIETLFSTRGSDELFEGEVPLKTRTFRGVTAHRVVRSIKGLEDAFSANNLTYLEGGYHWFRQLIAQSPDIFTVFISSFTPDQLALRADNQAILVQSFPDIFERAVAWNLVNLIRLDRKTEAVDLRDAPTFADLQERFHKWMEDYMKQGADLAEEAVEALGRKPFNKNGEVLDSLEAIRNNAELIESDRFINELNKLLGPKYFNHSFSVSPQGADAVLARALAYYIQKRLTEAGRSDSSAWLATSTEEEERKGIFTPPQDMFNRTLEGVAQTMLQEEYFGGDRRGKGIRIVNEFAYKVLSETDPKKIDAIINPLLRQQAQTIADHYFSYVLKAINRENKVRRSEMREAPDLLEVVDEHDQPTGKTIERKQAHQTGERHRAAILFAFNKKGELLMQKRGAQKDIFPDTWTFSASGHVDAGSTYAKTILKEAQEEMGMPLDPQRLNVVGASGMPWSDLKQYAYVFKTQDTEAALEATDRARERLIHESVLPIREDSEGLLWRAWPDSSQGTVTVFLYKLSAQRDTLLDDAKDKVGRILREMVGEYEDRVITNRDNRTHYVYRLSEQEEEFLSRRAEDVRRASQTDQAAEVTDLKFFSLDDLRQQFRDHPTLFVDDMLIFFDPQMNRDLEVMEDLSREAKVYEKTSETGLDQNVRELQKRLEEALRDPSADFDAIVFSVNPMFVSVVEETLEGLRGKVFHPKKEIVVLGQDPEGSITDSLSTADRALRKLYGDDYQTQVADKRVAVITMSGFGARMPTDFGKGLLSLPAGRTYLDQVLRQRFFFLDMDFRGLIVFSIDGINIPQYMPKMGKAGIQVIGMPMARTDENVGELGLFVIDEPFRPGAQPIRYAFEKLSRSQRDDYVARQLITKKYVNVSEANYPISWEAFSWLWEQTQSLRKVLDEKYKQEGKTYRDDNLAYNWAEHLFELAFLPDDLIPDYLERLVARSGSIDKDVFEGYLRIAREARQRFGMEFVNVGAESIYYNTNRPDQYRDFLISLISNQVFWEMFNLRNKDGKIVDQKADVSPAVFSKLVDNGVLVSRSIVDFAVQMKKGSLVFNSALAGGTKIETQGAVINSVGKFVVPRGAIVDTVIAPAEGLEVAPDSYTRGYLVRQTDGTVGQVLVSLPVKILASDGRTAELTVTDVKSSLMGKRLSRYKIFPREEHLTNRTPTLVEESPTKYSLDEVRNNIAHNVSWKLRNALAEAISENKKSAFQISETMREMVKNEKALVEKRSEVRGVEEEQVELPLADVGIDAAKAMLDALNAVATQRQEIRLGTGVKSSAAVSVESRLTNLILAIEKQTGKPFPAAFSPDTGAYVTGYNKDRIQNVLAMKEDGLVAEGVVVVIMAASEDDVRAAHNAFGSEIRDRQIEVVRSGANLVAERLIRRYGDSRVQIKPGAVVTEEDEAAYLAAAQLANGRVVFVGTNETVTGAYQISVAVMLQSAMEAAQAIATSA